ncbi:MAG: hypothetical protein ACKVS8_05035 [Phycisphaerales bacterium]
MADPATNPPSASRIDWKGVLPIPILLVGATLLVGGVVAGVLRAPKVSPVVPLEAAKIAFEERKFNQALDVLNNKVRPAVEEGRLAGPGERDFFLLRARVLSAAQAAQGVRNAENDKSIVEDYERAQKLGAEWNDGDQAAVAESLVGAGRTAEAIAMAKALPPELTDRRQTLFKRIVDANLRSRSVKFDETLALLGDLLEDQTLAPDDRAWALGKQAELRLVAGFPEEAATKLLRALPKAEGLTPERRGELVFLLGRAYEKMGDLSAAAAQLTIAESLLPVASPVRADALVLAGKLKQAEGKLDEARERFLAVVEAEGPSPTGAAALLGLAETIAGMGDDDAALERYRELVDRLATGSGGARVSPQDAGTSLMDRYTDRQNSGALAVALRYALLAERAYRATVVPEGAPAARPPTPQAGPETAGAGPKQASASPPAHAATPPPGQDRILDPVPPAVFLALGTTHKALAEQQLAEARTTEAGQLSIDQVSPVTQAEVKRHLLDAGAAYREHARLVLVTDDAAHAESLWDAAACFDLAGDRESAQLCFGLYSRRGDEDPRKAEAVFRMAQGFEAQRDYAAAAANYRELVDLASGPVSLRSIVPLARCYFADDQPGNDDDGEELLGQVLSGGTVGPEAEVYRDALVELGERAHRVGRFPLAVEKLGEAVARYPDHDRFGVLTFKLADAKRLSAAEIDRELREALPQARREELERVRRERLTEAGEAFAAAAQILSAKDPRQTTPMDVLALRNSTFYQGDVAFEQRDFGRAIALYDTARQKYSTDPASLVAMVQIVNAYVAQRLWSEAITANERARQQLASLPDDTWNDPNLPMERKHWERWLDSGRLIDRQKGEVHNTTSAAAQ